MQGKLAAETTTNPIGTRLFHHNITVSGNYVRHLEKVYSNVRQKLARQLEDDMPEIVVNAMIWEYLCPQRLLGRDALAEPLVALFFTFVELSDTRPTRDSAAPLRTLGHPSLVCAYYDGNWQHLWRKSHATQARHDK